MDGIHEVGGEQGFGRVEPTAEEPPRLNKTGKRALLESFGRLRDRARRIGTPTSSGSRESGFRRSSI